VIRQDAHVDQVRMIDIAAFEQPDEVDSIAV
jgi:hypothetical protein